MDKTYDLSKAVRGVHYRQYAKGHSVRLLDDEEPQAQKVIEDSNLVWLDSDVKAAFPDSQAVNEALRLLLKTAKNVQELAKVG